MSNDFRLLLAAILWLTFRNPILLPAQEIDEGKEKFIVLDTKIWDFSGDTLLAKIIYTNQFLSQFSIIRVDTAGKTLAYYTPKDIAGFSYRIMDEVVEFESVPNPDKIGRIFLRVLYRGRFALYQHLEINYKSSSYSFLVSYYLRDTDWILPPITQTFEKESLLYHFSRCPELEFKIKSDVYGLSQIRSILTEYEKCALTDQYEYFLE